MTALNHTPEAAGTRWLRRRPRAPSRHPVNRELVDQAPLGARIADDVTTFLGSWKFIVIQTVVVIIWVAGNIVLLFHFDPYPFILLNLAFSTQAAYAAPLILLAQTRQADRDKLTAEVSAKHRDMLSANEMELLQRNTDLTEQVAKLTQEIDALTRQIHGHLLSR